MKEIEQLIERLKQGEDSAFERIYELFESCLYNHLFQMLGSREKAEEAFQETMLKMIRKIDFYSPRSEFKNSFKAWVFRIGTNIAIDMLRKEKTRDQNLSVVEDSYLDEVEKRNFKERLDFLISELPSIQRTLLNLKVNEDLSHLEISIICGCNINAVKQLSLIHI